MRACLLMPVLQSLHWRRLRFLESQLTDGSAAERVRANQAVCRIAKSPGFSLQLDALGISRELPFVTAVLLGASLHPDSWAWYQTAIRTLARALGDRRPGVRKIAGQALRANVSLQAAIDILEGHLEDPRIAVRGAAADLLREASRPVSPQSAMESLFDDPSSEVRAFSANALGRTTAENLRKLHGLLRDGSFKVRAEAVLALNRAATALAESFPCLTSLMRHRHSRVAQAAIEVIGLAGAHRPEAAEILLRQAGSSHFLVCREALIALLAANRSLDRHRDQVFRLARHRTPHIRTAGAALLGLVGTGRAQTVRRTLELAEDSDVAVQKAAVRTLARIGRGSEETIGYLRRLATRGDQDRRSGARWALRCITRGRSGARRQMARPGTTLSR